MTFALEALRDKPLALYLLDDTSPFQDHSGYGRTATSTGTPARHAALVNGLSSAQVFDGTTTCAVASPVFKQGYEQQSFSLEVWVRPLSVVNTEQQILGNSAQLDGLTISGTTVSFVTKYLTAPEARVSYDLQQLRAVNLVGVHTEDKNSLYVDGVLVAEVSLTEEQQADDFAPTSSNLNITSTATGTALAVNAIGIYGSALLQESITRHYNIGRNLPNGAEVIGAFFGDRIALSLNNANLFLDQWWSTREEWEAADLQNVAVLNDQLVPQFDGDTSIAGEWVDTFAIGSAGATSIYGVSFNWDGIGAVVEVSLDDVTWETVERGKNVAMIPAGFDPTDEVLMVRVSFPGGIVGDTSYLDNLNAVGVISGVSPVMAGRTVTLTNATAEREYDPLAMHENWGVEIATGGNVTISADTSVDASPTRTLEMWVKRTSTTAPTFSVTGTTYINGEVGATLPINQWSLVHIVAAADVATDVVITGPAQVGQVGIYDTALSAATIEAVYAEYVGTNILSVGDNSVLSVTNSTPPVKIYAHDWSIQSSG